MSNLSNPSSSNIPINIEELINKTQVAPSTRSYIARVTRETPTAFVFLLDQSGSMSEKVLFGRNTVSKAEALAQIVNKTIDDLIGRCTKSDGVRDYAYVAVIGYGGRNDKKAYSAWEGELVGRTFVPLSELSEKFYQKNSRGGRCWITPCSKNTTPMYEALQLAHKILQEWLANYSQKYIFPPTVINITDGMATDTSEEDLLRVAKEIRELRTLDGNALLINVHITNKTDHPPFVFPQNAGQLPNDSYARLLYDMSSELPPFFYDVISKELNQDITPPYIGMTYNSDMKVLVKALNIGTASV